MELAIIGLVSSGGAVRLWTRDGSCDVEVDDPTRLQRLLGGGRVDREAMLPGGVETEMILLDRAARCLTVSAPFQPEDGQFFPLGEPFRICFLTNADVTWSDEVAGDLPERLAGWIERAGANGEVLTIAERDAQARGNRRVQCFFEHDGEEWCAVVTTNAPPENDEVWSQGYVRSGTTVLRLSDDADSPVNLALIAATAFVLWSDSPLDLVLGWSPAPDGARPRIALPSPATPEPPREPRSTRGRNHIEAIYIPWSLDEPVRVVSVDRRNVVAWYPFVNGGPAEAAHLRWLDVPDHELYVNSRYGDLDASLVNERATSLLEQCGVPMFLDHLRGDTLLVAGPGRGNYPRSAAPEVIAVLCD